MLFAAAISCVLVLSAVSRLSAQDVLTWHNDNARTGQNLRETTLTLQNVNPRTFGKLFAIRVDGKVDAEPLYAARIEIPHKAFRNVLFVATEHDSLYAFDADTGEQFWHVPLLKPSEAPARVHCGQIQPEIGITATPVIDRHRGPHGTIYVVAASTDPQGRFVHRLHALDLRTGEDSNQASSGRDHFGTGNKFITPMVAHGKVYVGTTDGVGVFGALPDSEPIRK